MLAALLLLGVAIIDMNDVMRETRKQKMMMTMTTMVVATARGQRTVIVLTQRRPEGAFQLELAAY